MFCAVDCMNGQLPVPPLPAACIGAVLAEVS
jgi:hypothetical protein